jgi:hypothetical protein
MQTIKKLRQTCGVQNAHYSIKTHTVTQSRHSRHCASSHHHPNMAAEMSNSTTPSLCDELNDRLGFPREYVQAIVYCYVLVMESGRYNMLVPSFGPSDWPEVLVSMVTLYMWRRFRIPKSGSEAQIRSVLNVVRRERFAAYELRGPPDHHEHVRAPGNRGMFGCGESSRIPAFIMTLFSRSQTRCYLFFTP